ncbi:nucleoside-diphosphate-sugar epimerase [Microbacterium terrae]|uniref:NAD dependent epimerase/dehydratase family protein n=1 Tax=Microbacterium terrae TaxID=69369 RepID=A0A0M2H3U6_9MICO|nr:NAD-dependent epimerase/dehydratase family protein [Microbacterium terrae]KJL38366.1 NAD dependent epimerase/dehydratase family protein [Microbacterium terrae]MBP1078993.1 nucleoside-diphosphate-sugar epimerase [Microbacterium terrae]GLJ98393.1 NAD-dependent dehydratase [Microbacterium terrae]
MQTILGAGGQIGTELARELHDHYTTELRLVSRNPQRLHETDDLIAASLLSPEETDAAVVGSDIVYLTVGLPPDAKLWAEQLPVMMRNTMDACERHGAKLVFFDNTYMYPMTGGPLTEETAFDPHGPKAKTRALIATMLLETMAAGRVEAVICRAPEFYGPGRTQSFTNSLFFDPIQQGRIPRVPLRDDTLRTLIWTPDASRAMALIGNTTSAYGQTWHLPCDTPISYEQLARLASEEWNRKIRYTVMPKIAFQTAGIFDAGAREIRELLPRYAHDNVFVTEKFTRAFPDFPVTTFPVGIHTIHAGEATPANNR